MYISLVLSAQSGRLSASTLAQAEEVLGVGGGALYNPAPGFLRSDQDSLKPDFAG
jgi:hypothetical protein